MTKIINVRVCEGEPGKPDVFLATPSYDGKVSQAYTAALACSIVDLQKAGIGVTYCLMGNNCHVDDSRNGLVREFMLSSCTDLIFLDADIGWRPYDLVALAMHTAPVVGGVYPKKTDEEAYPVYVEPNTALYANAEGLVEVHALPTGFLKINRIALEILHENQGQRKFAGQGSKPGDMPYTILFERTYENGHRWSGDYAFCRKWAAEGGKLFVDPRFHFIHEGSKEWSGCLGDYWLRAHGIADQIKEQKFKRALVAVEQGVHTAEHLQDLVDGWGNEGWSGQVELLEACITMGRNAKGPILECGSGLTTLVLGAVSNHPVITLEHNPIWGTYTQAMLDKHGIKGEIRCAPLKDYGEFEWYQAGELPEIALVVCDGPPRTVKGGRTGLASVMDKLTGAAFLMDDPAEEALDAVSAAHPRCIRFQMVGTQKPFAVSVEAA